MIAQPRVTAERSYAASELRTFGAKVSETPDVVVRVEFDHGDSKAALELLERAVSYVRAQITQTLPEVSAPQGCGHASLAPGCYVCDPGLSGQANRDRRARA
jgi:hypothetical protein